MSILTMESQLDLRFLNNISVDTTANQMKTGAAVLFAHLVDRLYDAGKEVRERMRPSSTIPWGKPGLRKTLDAGWCFYVNMLSNP